MRPLEGVVANTESLVGELFSDEEMLGPPRYTRPAKWDGEAVPGVLLSGNHAKIIAWRDRGPRHGRGYAGILWGSAFVAPSARGEK
jgi:tRNA (guanine37-N1)-methyltransferase